MRTLTFILGVVLAACCAAGILSLTLWQNNVEANRVLCRLLLCTNAPLELRAREQLTGVREEDVHEAINLFKEVLMDVLFPHSRQLLPRSQLQGRVGAE